MQPWKLEPYDMSKLSTTVHLGKKIYIESLEDLKRDNENYGRPERAKLIEEKLERNG